MHRRFKNYLILYAFIVAAVIVSFAAAKNLLLALLFFYLPPAIWLSFKIPQYIRRAAIFSFFGTVVFFVIDYIATLDQAWWISTIFPRILGILALENSIWAFLGMYTIVLFYEYFDDGAKFHKAGNHNTRLARNVISIFVLIFGVVYVLRPEMLHLAYAYLWLGIVFVMLPSIAFVILYPHLRAKLLDVSLYVFFLHLALELTFLHLHLATYPGTHFIGWVEVTGVRYPIEELVMWIGMCAVVTVTYYEVCLDMTDRALEHH